MSGEDDLRARISQLLADSCSLSEGDENGQCVNDRQQQLCSAWLTGRHHKYPRAHGALAAAQECV